MVEAQSTIGGGLNDLLEICMFRGEINAFVHPRLALMSKIAYANKLDVSMNKPAVVL